jgi:ParB family chromosome partitioning protein
MLTPASVIEHTPAIALAPRAWADTRWVGQVSGQATTHDVLAGAWVSPEARRAVSRAYAAACADLAQATLGGLPPHSADWDRWFGALRTAARELSPSRVGAHVVRRALHHGGRLEGEDALWAHRLRRGFAALLAARLPEPVPALIGEDLATFRAHDVAWFAQDGQSPDVAVCTSSRLSAPEPVSAHSEVRCSSAAEPLRWPIARLRPHPLNPRGQLNAGDVEELVASIVAHADQGGILQPLLVTPDGTVVAGHRRLAAARRAGLVELPVVVRELTPTEQLEVQLVENLQRADLSPIQEGRAYQHLVETGATLASIARAVGVSASRVRERLALLDLEASVQEQVHRGELPLNVAALLRPVHDLAQQRRLARLAVRRRLSMVQVRHLVEAQLALPPVAPAPLPTDDEPHGGGLSPTRQAVLEALRAEAQRPITCGELADLASVVCCACGLQSLPTICAECPNLQLLTAVLGQRDGHAA